MIEANDDMQPKQSLAHERLSYPLSLLYALQTLPGHCIGSVDDRPLEDLSSLTVHLVNSSPLFDPKAWESIIHRLPKLKKLHLVFIMQSKPFNESFGHNYAMSSLQRCSTIIIIIVPYDVTPFSLGSHQINSMDKEMPFSLTITDFLTTANLPY